MLDEAGASAARSVAAAARKGIPPRTGARLLRPAVVIEMLRRRAPSRGP